jgi:DNA-binding IclR family transcriptional regulator
VLRHRLVQIAISTVPVCSTLPSMKGEGRERFPLSANGGDRYPASVTAVGTALLSELTPAEVAQLYGDPRELIGFTERSTTTLTTLQSKLERTRERGYATDEGEVHPTMLGLAVLVPGRGSGEPSFDRAAETGALKVVLAN